MADFFGILGAVLMTLGFIIMALNMADILPMTGDSFGWGIASILVGMIAFIGALGAHDVGVREDFMKDCLMERRQYECTAMWRAGQTHVVHSPAPIYLPR